MGQVVNQPSEKERRQRRMLLLAPLIVAPLLALAFHGLGGGAGVRSVAATGGLNMRLPEARSDPRKKALNKLGLYNKADQDSVRRVEQRKQDPYLSAFANNALRRQGQDSGLSVGRPLGLGGTRLSGLGGSGSGQADELLKKLDQLKGVLAAEKLGEPATVAAGGLPAPASGLVIPDSYVRRPLVGLASVVQGDPDLEKLDEIMDKILRIKYPQEDPGRDTARLSGRAPAVAQLTGIRQEEVIQGAERADTDVQGFIDLDDAQGPSAALDNSIAAVVARAQTLVSGESVDFRLTQAAMLNGVSIPVGTLFSGKATLSGERLLVTVSAIRVGNGTVPVSLEVVDLDGMPGIREPGSLNRDVGKESADEAIGSLGETSLSTTVQGQATAAGLQTARNLLSRKVRLVRVSVPAGYAVLLRNTKSNH
jgi:hypothetical protein